MKTPTANHNLTGASASVGGVTVTRATSSSLARSLSSMRGNDGTGDNHQLCEAARAQYVRPSNLDLRAAARFYASVEKTPTCWLWLGSVNQIGRPYYHTGHKLYAAHRFSYMLHHGSIPKGNPKHSVLLHTCDNPICVNPAHLVWGTQRENINDAMRKGRFDHKKKLTDSQVAEIKTLLCDGIRVATIARRFNVSHKTITFISSGRTWSYCTPLHLRNLGSSSRTSLEVAQG